MLTVTWLLADRPALAQPVVGEGGARIVTIENQVRAQRRGTGTFANVVTNEVLGIGDSLSTGPDSSATLGLGDKALYRVDELTDLVLSPAGAGTGNRFQVELREGGFYLLNREKTGEQKFKTPTASGAILGTEVAVHVAKDGRTTVALLEGRVDLSNEFGSVSLAPGEQGDVQPGQAPTKTALLDAVAPVQWALYYPGVLNVDDLDPDLTERTRTALADSLAAYRAGDLPGALAAYPANRTPMDAAEETYRAALSLSVGQVARAEQHLGVVNSRDATALEKVIAVTRGQAQRRGHVGGSSTAWLAESYAAQSRSSLADALEAAKTAAVIAPNFGFAHERVAELEFSFGHTAAAKAALARALELSPRNAQAHSLQGFILAAENHIAGALAAFDRAIALDPHLAPARLGRGLCQVKQGQLAAGRADLQAAAALEPTRALFRSYLGKAWNEEHDLARADLELRRARELDPADPTAWLYLALLRQQQNRVNEAVGELEESRARNENRAVYRSRELLDQDRAVRGANLASVYRDAGLTEPAVREASRAVASDYGNASAHLFLASSYDTLRDPRLFNLRYETPWFSELLVANLLAPVGVGTLSQNISQQEYSRLFERDRVGVSSTTEYFSDGTWTERGSQFGTFGNFGYALDVNYRGENGFAPNTDVRQVDFYAKAKWDVTPNDSLFVQTLYSDLRTGDVSQLYDPNTASPGFRLTETQEPNLFVGLRHHWDGGGQSLLLFSRLDDSLAVFNPGANVLFLRQQTVGGVSTVNAVLAPPGFTNQLTSDLTAYGIELLHLQPLDPLPLSLLIGGRFQSGTTDSSDLLTRNVSGVVTNLAFASDLERYSAYAYLTWQPWEPVQFYGGVSYDHLRYPRNLDTPPITPGESEKDLVSPKLGFSWNVWTNAHVRGVYTRSLGGVFYDTSVRLEPVQLAGFTQAFRSLVSESVVGLVPGTEFETAGIGFDQKLGTRTYLSVDAEYLASTGDRTVGVFTNRRLPIPDTTSSALETIGYEERNLKLIVNQLLGDDFSLSAGYSITDSDLSRRFPGVPLTAVNIDAVNRDSEAVMQQIMLGAGYTHPCGFFSRFDAIWTRQSNVNADAGLPREDFWQFNVYAGYRFLQRRAEVRVGVLNLTGQDYRLNPLNLHDEYPRERTFYTSLRLNF